MESWTFLIQKDGDTTWLPLDVPESEILEGRYRVMGRASHINCPVAIQVSYLDVDGFPPRRKVQKRQAYTNQKGLVALLPFTHLKPGMWDIRCQYSLSSHEQPPQDGDGAHIPHTHHHGLQIQVLAQGLEPGIEAGAPESIRPVTMQQPLDSIGPGVAPGRNQAEAVASQNQFQTTEHEAVASDIDDGGAMDLTDQATEIGTENQMEAILAAADHMADHIIATMKEKLQPASQVSPPPSSKPLDSGMGAAPALADCSELGLMLNQTAYVVSSHAPLTLTGQVVGLDRGGGGGSNSNSNSNSGTWEGVTLGLQVQLLQPQTGDRVLAEQTSLSLRSLPTVFNLPISIPSNLDTHLLMGELVLLAPSVQPSADLKPAIKSSVECIEPSSTNPTPGNVLARQTFTVTVVLNTLLDTLKRMTSSPENQHQAKLSPSSPHAATPSDDSLQLPDPTMARAMHEDAKQQTRSPQTYNPLPPKLSPLTSATMVDLAAQPQAQPTSSSAALDLPSFLKTDDNSELSPLAIAISQALTASQSSSAQGEKSLSEPENPTAIAEQAVPGVEDVPNSDIDLTQSSLEQPESSAADAATAVDQLTPEGMADNPFGELAWDALEAQTVAVPMSLTTDNPTTGDPTTDGPNSDGPNSDGPNSDGPNSDGPNSDGPNSDGPNSDNWTATPADDLVGTDSDTQHEPLPESARTLNRLSHISQTNPSLEPELQPALNASAQWDRMEPHEQQVPQVSPPTPQSYPSFPQQVPIPTPVLHLPDSELVAGHSVRLTVTLPLSREVDSGSDSWNETTVGDSAPLLIFVKLWLQDRQTRSILDGPRWLVDFMRNPEGELEAMTQLVLPIGCLEVSVEAIAVELLTQRESNKFTLYRTVTPTNLPPQLTSFSLDDLN
ncbi:MAG: hypothetical protein F6K30_08250 [Cyanothece sp. SIO2G6]|nr:hypothetical protein [Cyanothece sp. SIO2G6]